MTKVSIYFTLKMLEGVNFRKFSEGVVRQFYCKFRYILANFSIWVSFFTDIAALAVLCFQSIDN